MFRDEYGRKILCDTGCPLGSSAEFCKYCKSGECEADREKKTVMTNELYALLHGEAVSYGGRIVSKNHFGW